MAENTIITLTSPEGATLNTSGTYCEGDIEVVPKLQSKTATTGEIVTADDGYAGLKTNPANMFSGPSWTNETYTPTKDLKNIFNASNMYNNCHVTGSLEEIHQRCGVILDLSMSVGFNGCFAYSKISGVGEVNCARDGFDVSANTMFANAKNLTRIAKLIVGKRTQYSNTFLGCIALTDLTVEGEIVGSYFDVSWSPLSKASLTSVVNALSSTTTGLTVTLRLDAVKKAFETSEGANDGDASDEWLQLIATKPNWTINTIDS